MGVEYAGPGHAESLVLGVFFGKCRFGVGMGLAWRSCLPVKLLNVLVPSVDVLTIRNLKAVACRCRFLALKWDLDAFGVLLNCPP